MIVAFDEAAVRLVTGMIASESKELLEIVNLNVDGEQYVCAGHVSLTLGGKSCSAQIWTDMCHEGSQHLRIDSTP